MRMLDRKIGSLITAANIPEKKVTYGIKITKGNPDPVMSVTYTDDAVSFSPSFGNNGSFIDNGWKNRFPFNKIKPCLLKNGTVQHYLNPDDFTKKLDGSSSDITSGNDGNVMIEFPKIWYSIEQDSSFIYVRYSNFAQDGFTDWAMSYKGIVRDKFYIGAYMCSIIDEKLCSLSGKFPDYELPIGSFRRFAQSNGDNYEIMAWNKLILLQVLYLVRFKSLDGQTALGNGVCTGDDVFNTGTTDKSGMDYGEASSIPVKFCGLEDFWGSFSEFIDGMILNADGKGGAVSGNIAVADGGFNDNASGYIISGTAASVLGYTSTVFANAYTGFIAAEVNGSLDTYFCDVNYLVCNNVLRVPNFGGNFISGSQAGPFNNRIYVKASGISEYSTARLMYCG